MPYVIQELRTDYHEAKRAYDKLSVLVRKAQVTIRNRHYDVDIRIDGRDAGVFRVDMKSFPFEPWESIDGGSGSAPTTFAEAEALVARWVAAVNVQQTLSVSL